MSHRPSSFRLCTFVALLFVLCSCVWAHPEGLSGLRLLVWPDHARAILTIHTRDMSNWFPPRRYPNYVADVCAALAASPTDVLQLASGDAPITPTDISATSPEVGLIKLEFSYALAPSTTHLQIWSKHLPFLPRAHQQVLQIDDMRGQPFSSDKGHYLKDDTLDIDHDASDFDLPTSALPTSQPALAQAAGQIARPESASAAPTVPLPALLTAAITVPVLVMFFWLSRRRPF
jgi:hypothetical protein